MGTPVLTLFLALAATGPEVTLSGLVLARSGRNAATLISEGRARPVTVGDRAFGCDVAAIHADSVDLVCGSERRTLRLNAAPVLRTTTATAAAEPAAQLPPADFTMNRAELEGRLNLEMSRLMTETTLVPVTSRGQVAGFTLSRVPAGTILETIGLKAGDVLINVNETPIDSFATLIGLWPKLQSSGSVKAQILRDGRPLDISVSIK
ncbi:MAG: hypothetical protein ABI672_03940 [Vicinamibacteria bacterium]